MNVDKIRFVLVATSHPGNIGSAARALKTMGFKRLYLVNPKAFPHHQAIELAAGADDILENCQCTHTLQEALTGCQLVIATSARSRHLSLPLFNPKSSAEFVGQQADDTEIAIVFGREHAGLTNEELLQSHYQVMIPSNPEYSSLNLAQAVQIMAYELRMQSLEQVHEKKSEHIIANVEEVERFYAHLEKVLVQINFLKASNIKVLSRLRRLFNRAALEQVEVQMLRGILTQISSIHHES